MNKDLKDKRHPAVHNRNRNNICGGEKKNFSQSEMELFLIMVQNLDGANINRGQIVSTCRGSQIQSQYR